nr:amidase [Candidatus Omnitrophota bacterium]
MRAIKVGENLYGREETASVDVDAQNTFTPLCMGELPVPGGNEIVEELNTQAFYAKYRIGSKDAHSMASLWVDSDKEPQFTKIAGYANMDIRWRVHGVPGTFGFNLINGLPPVTEYNYFIWKGMELDMHPYGICYHDLNKTLSTGVIEWARDKGIRLMIVGGLATDYCVKDAVLQLLEAGFCVILNLGACRGIAEDTTAAAIEQMRKAGKDLFTTVRGTAEIRDLVVE